MANVINLSSLALASDGKTLTATLSGGSAPYSMGHDNNIKGVTFKAGGVVVPILSARVLSSPTLTIVVDGAISGSVTCTLDVATSADITDSASNAPTGQSAISVTNGSTVGAPTITALQTNAAGTEICGRFEQPVTGGTIGFTLGGTAATLGTITVSPLWFSAEITGHILGSDTPTLSYASGTGNIKDANNNALASFSNAIVANNVQGTVGYTQLTDQSFGATVGLAYGLDAAITTNWVDRVGGIYSEAFGFIGTQFLTIGPNLPTVDFYFTPYLVRDTKVRMYSVNADSNAITARVNHRKGDGYEFLLYNGGALYVYKSVNGSTSTLVSNSSWSVAPPSNYIAEVIITDTSSTTISWVVNVYDQSAPTVVVTSQNGTDTSALKSGTVGFTGLNECAASRFIISSSLAGGPVNAGNISTDSSDATKVAVSRTKIRVTTTVPTTGTPAFSYQWHISTTNGFTPSGGTAVSGATTQSAVLSTLTANTTYYIKCVYTDSASTTATSSQLTVKTLKTTDPIILLVGDSITFGVISGGSGTPAWQVMLARFATDGLTAAGCNVAVSGTTSGSWSGDISATIAIAKDSECNYAQVMLGTNDASTTARTTPATYKSNIQALIGNLTASGTGITKVILHVPPWSNIYSPGGTNWDATSESLEQQYGAQCATLIDGVTVLQGDTTAWTYFFTHQSEMPDVHPSVTGHNTLGNLWANAIEALLLSSLTATGTLERGQAGQTITLVANALSLTNVAGNYTLSAGTVTSVANGSPNDALHKVLTVTSPPSTGTVTVTFNSVVSNTINVTDTTAPNSVSGMGAVTNGILLSWTAVPPSPAGETITYDVKKNGSLVSSSQSATNFSSAVVDGDVFAVITRDNSGNTSSPSTITYHAPVIPAESDVRNGVSVGSGTGTLILPGIDFVASGLNYGGDGDEFTGVVVTPVTGDVRNGVQFSSPNFNQFGTLVVPVVGNVRAGITYDNGSAGVLNLPTTSTVLSGTIYDNGGASGNVILPGASDVRQSTHYGPNNTDVGSLDLPDPSDVRSGVVYDGGSETGTMTGGGTAGAGADRCTLTITNSTTMRAISDALVWITSDADGADVIAGTLTTDDHGDALFLLTAGNGYYLWMKKDGFNSIVGQHFTAVAD